MPDLPKLSAPARRALDRANITDLAHLAHVREADVVQMHGMGPKALRILREAMVEHGISYRS